MTLPQLKIATSDERCETLRVCILGDVSRRSGGSHGGTGIAIIRLANALSSIGITVSVITADADQLSHYGEKLGTGIPLRPASRGSKIRQTWSILNHLTQMRTQVLLAFDTRGISLGIVAKRLLRGRLNLVCCIHNSSVVRSEIDSGKEKRKAALFHRMSYWADALVTPSPGLLNDVQNRTGPSRARLGVIPNPAFGPDALEAAHAQAVPRPTVGVPHLVSVGRLQPEKDQETLLRALASLHRDHGVQATLTLLGEGAALADLRALASELGVAASVYFEGFVRYPMAYLVDADCFVLSSVREAFGYVLLEAMSMGVPVVSTDCPHGPRYILDGGQYGALVRPGDPAALAKAVADMLVTPTDPSLLRARASEFSAESVAREYEALLYALISRPALSGRRNAGA